MSRPSVREEEGLLRALLRRITLVERRLAVGGGGGGGATVISEGPGIDIDGTGTGGDPYVISAELPALPPPSRFDRGADTFSVTATSIWGDTIPGAPASITTDRPLWALVTMGAWIVASAGETRASFRGSGATTIDPSSAQTEWGPPDSLWGEVLYLHTSDAGGSSAAQRSSARLVRLNAGTTTFVPVAYMATAGTHGVNYVILDVTPIAYVDTPVPVKPTVGVLTRRTSTAGQAVATNGPAISWNVPAVDSGHFTYDAATFEFTCVIPGTYRLTTLVGFSSVAADNIGRVQMQVNGVVEAEPVGRRLAAQAVTLGASVTKALAVGDKVRVVVIGSIAGGTIDTTTGRTFIDLVPVVVTAPDGTSHEDTGWVLPPVVVEAGWTLHADSKIRVRDGVLSAFLRFTYSGATITAAANGNITEAQVGTLGAGWRPTFTRFHFAYSVSANAFGEGYVNDAGLINLSTLAPTNTITSGQNVYINLSYLL